MRREKIRRTGEGRKEEEEKEEVTTIITILFSYSF